MSDKKLAEQVQENTREIAALKQAMAGITVSTQGYTPPPSGTEQPLVAEGYTPPPSGTVPPGGG